MFTAVAGEEAEAGYDVSRRTDLELEDYPGSGPTTGTRRGRSSGGTDPTSSEFSDNYESDYLTVSKI